MISIEIPQVNESETAVKTESFMTESSETDKENAIFMESETEPQNKSTKSIKTEISVDQEKSGLEFDETESEVEESEDHDTVVIEPDKLKPVSYSPNLDQTKEK